MRAHQISTWACGNTAKVAISLHPDLHEKVYFLDRSNDYLRKRFVICHGELHAVFVHLRAIGSFTSCSGIDDACMDEGWSLCCSSSFRM